MALISRVALHIYQVPGRRDVLVCIACLDVSLLTVTTLMTLLMTLLMALMTTSLMAERAAALARVTEEAAAAAAAVGAPNSQGADVLFGSAGGEHSGSNSGGESRWTTESAPPAPAPVAPAAATVSTAEAEQLQAHVSHKPVTTG